MFTMRKKTSIVVDAELWKRWINFVVSIHGSSRKISDEVEKALTEYMMRGSYRMSSDELRRILKVRETKLDIKVPENIEKKILDSRRKRVFNP